MIDYLRRKWALYCLLREHRKGVQLRHKVEAAIRRLEALQRVDEN